MVFYPDIGFGSRDHGRGVSPLLLFKKMRTRVYRLILLFLFIFIGCGLFFFQIIQGGIFFNQSLRNSIRLIPEEPLRGRILDRNNNVLADNILSFDAVLIPQEIKDKAFVFGRLAKILSLSEDALAEKYENSYLNPFTPIVIAAGISKAQAITLEEQNLDVLGAHVALNAQRVYPYATAASHVLGYIGEIDRSRITRLKDYGYDIKDKMGYSGIEERLDLYLRGEKGGQQVEVDSRGRQVRLLGYRPAVVGKDVQLSIDLELQQITDQLLKDYRGAVVVMDVETGEILVLSSSPAFNPNVFVDRKDQKLLSYYMNSENAPLFNRVISGKFPPGSIFKVITTAAALNEKNFSPSLTYECAGKMAVGSRYFKCWATHGAQDLYQAMAHSCDVYFYHLGLSAGPDALTFWSHEFGLASVTDIDLRGEVQGFIPSRLWKRLSRFENWYDGDTANFSIGQGAVSTTPIQLCRMMAAVANNGILLEPHVTRAIGCDAIKTKVQRKIKIAQKDLDLLRDLLRQPVLQESGTAHVLDIAGLDICAKTGTAQVSGEASHGWVSGFFPKDKPRYAFCVLLENVGSSAHACVLAKQLFEEALKRNKLN